MFNIFKDFVIDNELYVNECNWSKLKNDYTQEHIIKEISDAIVEFNIKLPYREISLDDVKSEYVALKNLSLSDLYCEGEWGTKFEYDYHFNPRYIGISNVGNKASDYFHQVERWKCDATGYPSPQKTWDNERFRLTLFKALFSLDVKEINPKILRHIIGLRKYIAAQFRPSAAKIIYDLYKPKTVLDFSMGWGDRILGAHASDYVKKYIGMDPNESLLKGYLKQLSFYHEITKPIKKEFNLIPSCAEDSQVYIQDDVDLVFTSPPYFDKEKYDQSENQSYKKHKGFDNWMENFLFKSIELRTENLKSGGVLAINISDIYTRKKRFKICDGMNNYIASTNKFEYDGAIGLRMPKRPMSKSSKTVGVFAEPIWIWKKK